MKSVELRFTYTQDECVNAQRQYLFASKIISKTSVIFLALYLPCSIYYLFASSQNALSIVAVVLGFLLLVIGCVLYFYTPIQVFKQTSKYHEEYHLTFSNDGIRFKTATINSELKWNTYSEFWETNNFYFLIQGPRIYSLIPKRAFVSNKDKQTFEEIVLSNLNCKKRILCSQKR